MTTDQVNEHILSNYSIKSDQQLAEEISDLGYPINSEAVRKRRRKMGLAKDIEADQPYDRKEVDRIARLIIDSMIKANADPREIEQMTYRKWQMGMKNADQEFESHDLEGVTLKLDPTWKTGPKWPVVQQADPIKIVSLKRAPNKNDFKTAVILPDTQIGFLRDSQSEEMIPFHDELAMQCSLRLIEKLNPDLIVNLGDFLDFPQFGRFIQQPGFALTTKPALNRAHKFLNEQKANAPNAKIVLIEGNHDMRLQTSIITNAQAAHGIQRANMPDEWPVMSIPFLLRLDELNVEYVGGYPAGEYYINDRLKCVHGHKVRSATSTARAVIDDERVSTIFGHVHRIEVQYKTTHVRSGPRISLAMTPGCLCRIDGAVPSVKSGVDPFGRPLTSYENWQNGCAIVHYQDGDKPFSVTPVFINEGQAVLNGEVI